MMQSLDPYAVSPKEMQELISLHAFLDSSGLEEPLIELLRLNVSRLNGCTQGVRRHSRRACVLGESIARLAALGASQGSSLFTEKERVALEWSEAVTFASRSRVSDHLQAAIRQWFTDLQRRSDREAANATALFFNVPPISSRTKEESRAR
jgi:AhpD family alkylhydroperoxidase